MGLKASDNFQINQAWWKKEKPLTLKTTGLGAVMKKYQDAKGKITVLSTKGKYSGDFAGPVSPFEAAAAILEKELPAAVTKAKSMCGKLLHKDCITVLDKAKAAISQEKIVLQQLETNFDNTYKATYFTPKMNQATQLETGLTNALDAAEKLSKKAEESSKIILKRFQYLKTLEKAGTLQELDIQQAKVDVKGDMASVKTICDQLDQMVKSAEVDEKAAGKIDGEIKGVLSFRDQDLVRKKLNAVASLKNYILDVSKRTAMLQASVLTNVNEFKAGVTGNKTPAVKQLATLKELQKTMTGNEGATRKLENAFTNILIGVPKMIRAVKEAPDRASIKIPDGVNVPVDKWLAQVKEWQDLAKKHLTKCEAILKQSDEIYLAVTSKIDKAVLDGNEGTPIHEDIKAKKGGIKTYVEKCDSDEASFGRYHVSLTSEFNKKN